MPLASLVHEQPSCLIAPLKLPVPVTTLCENSLNDGAFSSGLRGWGCRFAQRSGVRGAGTQVARFQPNQQAVCVIASDKLL